MGSVIVLTGFPGERVTEALAVLVESATLVARTVTVCVLLMLEGAV